jgi:cytochrome c-type biogenesis protein CcsB
MKKISETIFSMQLTVILMLLFALSAGIATFIENDFGTTAAKVAVYNATWFEVLLLLLTVNLTGSIFLHKLWQRRKYTLLLFHLAFIIMFIGAAVTRYYGFEGMMHIREGSASGKMISDKTYISAVFTYNNRDFVKRKAVLLSGSGNEHPAFTINTDAGPLDIKTLDYVPGATMEMVRSDNGGAMLSLMTVTQTGHHTFYLQQHETKNLDSLNVSFDDPENAGDVRITLKNDGLAIVSAGRKMVMMNMQMTGADTIPAGVETAFLPRYVYVVGKDMIVLRDFEKNARLKPVRSSQPGALDALVLEISANGTTKETVVWGKKGIVGDFTPVDVSGQRIRLAYGSVDIRLPFKVKLNDFILEKYPGSNSPSSFASEVTVLDEKNGKQFDFRIFMNHVLRYKGYRFYQSSYDNDEHGTILSVNHDGAGTAISYFGYALMTLGMLLSLFSRKTRFRRVLKMIDETRKKRLALQASVLFAAMLIPSVTFGGEETRVISGVEVNIVDKDIAADFGRLIVLGTNGRLEPVNTLSSKILRKFTGKNTFEGLTPDQVVTGILSQSDRWKNVPVIKIKNRQLREVLRLKGKYAAFTDFFDYTGQNGYLLSSLIERAYQKKTMQQTKFDKAVIKADEKVNIFYMLYTGNLLHLFPDPDHPGAKWYNPADELSGLDTQDSLFVKNIIPMFAQTLQIAFQTGDFTQASKLIEGIAGFQEKYAAGLLPDARKVNVEILLNKANVFERLFRYYGLLGMVFLLILFLNLIFPNFKTGWVNKIMIGILSVLFVFQTLGLAARWYVSGHAPLSNGYESMIFIAWATMLAGFLLVRRSPIALAATTVLASLTLFVAHLNWMNPEVTNLVPVLKSVWLTIHVAVITSSYGFLGLGMILGLFNLLLMIFQNKNNFETFDLTIKEISLTIEATLTIGLYMITIGTFLGGVWANESWGRYWGWDPKETWALVTVLVYAVIIHLNFIPGLVGRFLFNALAVLGFSSVLMTYFGVNYYLTGLHSYAGGEPVPIPAFVYYTIASLVMVLVLAGVNNYRLRKMKINS